MGKVQNKKQQRRIFFILAVILIIAGTIMLVDGITDISFNPDNPSLITITGKAVGFQSPFGRYSNYYLYLFNDDTDYSLHLMPLFQYGDFGGFDIVGQDVEMIISDKPNLLGRVQVYALKTGDTVRFTVEDAAQALHDNGKGLIVFGAIMLAIAALIILFPVYLTRKQLHKKKRTNI